MEVACPNCQKTVVWSPESPFRPFCSKRCRMIDLGSWADDSYAIPVKTPVVNFPSLNSSAANSEAIESYDYEEDIEEDWSSADPSTSDDNDEG